MKRKQSRLPANQVQGEGHLELGVVAQHPLEGRQIARFERCDVLVEHAASLLLPGLLSSSTFGATCSSRARAR